MSDLILASASPRRAEILRQLQVAFAVLPADIDEEVMPDESPDYYVRRVALAKAEAVSAKLGSSTPVLAADTAVVADGQILGKPSDREHAQQILASLSNRWHEVFTGIAIMQQRETVVSVRTRVKLRSISAAEIDAYWLSGEPQDKAGAYAIQGSGGAFVERIEGSYSNVVGLPMAETIILLNNYVVDHIFTDAATT